MSVQGAQGFVEDSRNDALLVYVNGDLVPKAEAKVSVFDSGFVLGDGVWDAFRLVDGTLVFMAEHLERLFEGARSIDLDIGLTEKELADALYRTVDGNGMRDGAHLRLMVTRGVKKTPNQDPRYAALAEILALEATHDPEVREWRARHLPDGLVSEAELVDTLARIGEWPRWAKLPAQAIARRNATTTAEKRTALAEAKAEVIWRARTTSTTSSANEALRDFARIADRLARGFKWLPDDILIFFVTGRAPRYFPVIVRTRSTDRCATSRITLEVDPRISQRELARAYTDAQANGRLVGVAGGTSRRIEPRAAALAVFIAGHLSAPWRERQKLWNEEHAEWQSQDVRAFRTEARRAWQRVVGGEVPDSEDEWLSDVRASALMVAPPGTLPRLPLALTVQNVNLPIKENS